MNILLVEDDNALASALADSLRHHGYAVNWVDSGKMALSAIQTDSSDMAILDLGLPDIDGLTVLKTVRKAKITLPILILTARDSVDDKVNGLDAGADDYLAKPFDMTELLARLRVLERRLGNAQSSTIDVANVSLNVAEHSCLVDNEAIKISRREFMLLRVLMENIGRVMSKQQLENKLYEWGDEVASNTIEVHISNLRKKLPTDFIKTIRGVGYTTPRVK